MEKNNYMFISHYHDIRDGYPNLEEDADWLSDDRVSLSSVVRKPALQQSKGFQRSAVINREVNTIPL